VHADVTLARSEVNVKVTGLLNFEKLPKIALFLVYLLRHFALGSKLMVGYDRMGPGLQVCGARLSNFFLKSYEKSSNFTKSRYYTNFKWPYFGAVRRHSHTVGHDGSTIGIVYTDVTLTRSKAKIKFTELLKLRQLSKIALF